MAENLQLVDQNKVFNRDFQSYIQKTGIAKRGFDYHVTAVFGSQSTGKSTLLNKLFGTEFRTMSEDSRQQTTKGIWMAAASDSSTLVMDVEGTDGRERGDDQEFERKSALFSISTSEVILINMWEHQVGLYQGANMGLLKTVFEVNLQLFHGDENKESSRCLLLFVIRDFVGGTPLENLEQTIRKDLANIWASISKPDSCKDALIDDFFDFQFVGLPHKILLPDKFETDVGKLRNRFFNSNDQDYVFQPSYHRRIPADGFPHYCQTIWEQIESNKDLDLPAQHQLLAQFRCDEISTDALEKCESLARSMEETMRPGIVTPNLGRGMRDAQSEVLAMFDQEASRYHNDVYQKKRADVVNAIEARLQVLFIAQLNALYKDTMNSFEVKLKQELVACPQSSFVHLSKEVQTSHITDFKAAAADCMLSGSSWSFESQTLSLKSELEGISNSLKKSEMDKQQSTLLKQMRRKMKDPIHVILTDLSMDSWDPVLDIYSSNREETLRKWETDLKAYGSPDLDNEKSISDIDLKIWKEFREVLDTELNPEILSLRLRDRFERLFKYDEKDIPRIWRSGDDIDSVFKDAFERTNDLIGRLSVVSRSDQSPIPYKAIPEDDEEDPLRIFSTSQELEMRTKLKRAADTAFLDAKRSAISSVSSIPLYIYVLLFLLGWNELVAVLRNPISFTILIVAMAGLFAVYQLNMFGPLQRISRTILSQSKEIAREKLRDLLDVKPPQATPTDPHLANGNQSGSTEPKKGDEF